jgi:cell division protein ZapA (FtsZ GTPase activity inhibitor)
LEGGYALKIIIVIDTPSLLSTQAEVFIRTTERLKELFKESFETILPSCMLVVTKVNIVYSLSDICEYISDIASGLRRNKDARLLIRTLLDQKNITIYSTPERMSNYIEIIRDNIEKIK